MARPELGAATPAGATPTLEEEEVGLVNAAAWVAVLFSAADEPAFSPADEFAAAASELLPAGTSGDDVREPPPADPEPALRVSLGSGS